MESNGKRSRPTPKTRGLPKVWKPTFDEFVPLGTKAAKMGKDEKTIFKTYSLGVATCRDDWVYDFQRDKLEADMHNFIEEYNARSRALASER